MTAFSESSLTITYQLGTSNKWDRIENTIRIQHFIKCTYIIFKILGDSIKVLGKHKNKSKNFTGIGD